MSEFGNFRGRLKQYTLQRTPGTAPYTLKQVLRVNKENQTLEHAAYWTLRLNFFAFGETVNGQFCTIDNKPVVIFTWSTPSVKAYNKDKTSDTIMDIYEFDSYIDFFTPESQLGQHFIKFKELYRNEWDMNLYKWAKHHYRQRLIMPRFTPDYIAEQVYASFEKNV
jgi:hypothetical protein